MHKWIIAIAVVFLVALVIGISIGRYHYEHITLPRILAVKTENNNKNSETIREKNAIINIHDTSDLEPVSDIFLGEYRSCLLRRLNIDDCKEMERLYITPPCPLPGSFSERHATAAFFYADKVCGIEHFYASPSLKDSLDLFNSLEITLRLKYKNYLIYDIENIPERIKRTGMFFDDDEKTFVIKEKVNGNNCCMILSCSKTMGVLLKYISLDVLNISL